MGRAGWLLRIAAIGAAILAVLSLVAWHEQVWWWIEVHTGTVNEGGPFYGCVAWIGDRLYA
jgi:hypothetical protein